MEDLRKEISRLEQRLKWLNWYWWRSCTSKKNTFPDIKSAQKLADTLNKQKRNKKSPVQVYKCRFGHRVKGKIVVRYHVGHSKPKRK